MLAHTVLREGLRCANKEGKRYVEYIVKRPLCIVGRNVLIADGLPVAIVRDVDANRVLVRAHIDDIAAYLVDVSEDF